jgi:uncharacterized protein (TIGR03083 family)
MNTVDILMYGDRTLRSTLDVIPRDRWRDQGVCGWWSVKDILGHLASYELWQGDVLQSAAGQDETGYLDEYSEQRERFNDVQVARRTDDPPAQVLDEYIAAHERLMAAAQEVPADALVKNGTIPWYGEAYSIDDLLVYSNYGHKREHCAQIHVFKDQIHAGA